MNARRVLFARLRRPAGTTAALAGGLLLAGCVGNPFEDARVDPASPVAAEVARAARVDRGYPTFWDIPRLPDDMRPLRAYGEAAEELRLIRARIEQATAPETWTLRDTEGFAEAARRRAGPELPPPEPFDAEGYARQLRERATPPPPR